MTATRDPDRLLRAWLDLMPDEAPDRAIAAVLQAAETTRQVRALPRIGRWRLSMNRLTLIATAALVIAALVGGAYLLSGGSHGPALATPSPAATTATPPSPTATAEPGAPAATLLWGAWEADVEAMPAIAQTAGRIQLIVDYEAGVDVHFEELDQGFRTVLQSAPLSAAPNELRLRSSADAIGCPPGTIGRYAWQRSDDGMFLTVTVVEEACPARASMLARTWARSLGVINDGGRGVNIGLKPAYEVTLPRVQLAQGGPDQAPVIHTCASSGCGSGGAFDSEPGFSFVTIKDPLGWGNPCEVTTPQKVLINQTTAAFVSYMKGLPGLTVTTKATQVGGRPAVRLGIASDAGINCPLGEIHLFRSNAPPENNGGDYNLQLGDTTAMWIVDLGGGDTVLFWYIGDGITAADQQTVIDSIKFLDKMPTS